VQALAAAIGSKTAQQVSDYSQYVCEVSFIRHCLACPLAVGVCLPWWWYYLSAMLVVPYLYVMVVVLPLGLVALR
jgi:hypothetical protein